ncbi:hypothetical protein GCM10017708_37500 [Arthrobacter citreus]
MDQPATIGALPVAVAQATGAAVGYLPGLAMRRIADLHPGQAKTDARDAAIIAEAARSMPHTLRSVELDDETLAELGVLCGFDDDLAGQITATSNRIRGLLTQIHPALERALGPHLDHPAVADLLTRYPTPQALKTAGRGHVRTRLKKQAPRAEDRLTEAVFTALDQQTVVVVGTGAAGIVLPKLAEQLLALRRQRDEITAQVEALVEAHPLYEVLTSMPGIGVRTCARILTEVTGKHFASAAHLASYAGIAPVTHRFGTSIRVSIRAGEATRSLNEPCSSRPSPHCIIHRRGSITTANAPRANAITRQLLPWPVVVPMFSSPCSATEPSTKTRDQRTCPQPLDENHRGTPKSGKVGFQLRRPATAGRAARRFHTGWFGCESLNLDERRTDPPG